MAENINISFAPNKAASEAQRIADIEQHLATLTERTKFAFASIIEDYGLKDSTDEQKLYNAIYQTASGASGVGQFTNTDKNCEVFNDYENNVASSYYAHAEGYKTTANAPYAHAEGYATTASAPSAHAEGEGTAASQNAHSEGVDTKATGYASHAEGKGTVASGWVSHSEGCETEARGLYSHAEGENCKAIGSNSHAGGMYSEALSEYSFAHGYGAKSSWTSGTALGRRNKTQNTLFVIGNGGWQEGSESDALTLDENGMLWIEGSFEASAKHGGLGIAIHGAARFGNNWNSDGTNILLAVGNGYDSERTSDALVLDSNGNLWVAGSIKCGGDSGGYTLPPATADTLGGVMIGENINVSDSGTISVDLSAYLKSDEISDWAKAENKPAYTAQEVGASTAADITAAVNAVEIGGRNLLYDSTGNLKNGWNANVAITENGGLSGNSLAISRTGYSGNARYFGISKRHFLTDFAVGTSYTLSAWIKVRSDVGLDASGYVMARFRSADDKKLYALSLTVSSQTEKDKWIYYEKTWTINDSDIAKLECVALALDKNGMIEVCDIKLEKGNKATDWSPAVEEDTERITSLEARVAALEAAAVSGGEV